MKKLYLTYFTLFLIYFLDLAGIALVFVVFSPLIVLENSPMLSPATSLDHRNLILGFLLASYPIAQFLGAPILGELSDRVGRRPILLVSSFVTFVSFAMTGVAVLMHSLAWLFISRIIGGLSAGNLTVAQTSASDLTEEKRRARMMALFPVTGGFAWVVAPYIGSLLSNKKLVPWFGYDVPFWTMALLFLCAFLLTLWKVKESHPIDSKGPLPLHRAFGNLSSVFHLKPIVLPLLCSMGSMIGWMTCQGFFAAYLVEEFHFDIFWVGNAFAFFSLFWLAGGLLANQWVLKHHSPETVNLPLLVLVALGIWIFSLVSESWAVWVFPAAFNLIMALSVSCFSGIFALRAPKEMQGKVFGIWNAGFALAAAIGPALAGWLARYDLGLPFWAATLIIAIFAVVYIVWYWRYHAQST